MTTTKAPNVLFVAHPADKRNRRLAVGRIKADFAIHGDDLCGITFHGEGSAADLTMLGMVLRSAAVRWSNGEDLWSALRSRDFERGRPHGEVLGRITEGDCALVIELAPELDPTAISEYTVKLLPGGRFGLASDDAYTDTAQLGVLGELFEEVGAEAHKHSVGEVNFARHLGRMVAPLTDDDCDDDCEAP